MTALERALNKVVVDEETGCWIWQGSATQEGYSKVNFAQPDGTRVTTTAHKRIYELIIKPVDAGMELDHAACGTRLCVNPAHLEEVTHAENRYRARKITCKRGHVLANARLKRSHGYIVRDCNECAAMREKAYRQRRKQIVGVSS